MKYVIIQKKDFKSISIGKESEKKKVQFIYVDGSPIKMPLYILMNYFKYGKASAIIFRYLNDYPSFIKTFLRLLSEVFSILLSKILKIKLFWICHNIDRETDENYPQLTRFRRIIFTKFSNKIIVTDPLLVRYAAQTFPNYKNKIESITFGPYKINNTINNKEDLMEKINRFVLDSKGNSEKTIYGFVAGNINWKTAQFYEIPTLMNKAANSGYKIRMIIIGPIGNYLIKNNLELYNEFKNNIDILFLDNFYSFDIKEISKYIDFYFRIYLDLSIPATIYESAYIEKPIITQNKGFLGEAVANYSLGYVLNEDYSNLDIILNDIQYWDNKGAKEFLKTHSWEKSAEKIIDLLN